jgi:DNA-binding Lrp family transcriptional regulator
MVDMYVLATCDLGRTEEIASELREINQVQEVHMINGVYDIILKMSCHQPKIWNTFISKLDISMGLNQHQLW